MYLILITSSTIRIILIFLMIVLKVYSSLSLFVRVSVCGKVGAHITQMNPIFHLVANINTPQ